MSNSNEGSYKAEDSESLEDWRTAEFDKQRKQFDELASKQSGASDMSGV